jgi:hypothetical protein
LALSCLRSLGVRALRLSPLPCASPACLPLNLTSPQYACASATFTQSALSRPGNTTPAQHGPIARNPPASMQVKIELAAQETKSRLLCSTAALHPRNRLCHFGHAPFDRVQFLGGQSFCGNMRGA